MKNENKNQTYLDKYDSYEAIPSAIRAWITIRAKKEGKNPVMAHAGIKAAFRKAQKQLSITIIREDLEYMDGCDNSPFHHILKAKNPEILNEKITAIYDDLLKNINKNSNTYKKAVKIRDSKVIAMIDNGDTIDIDGATLKIISDPDHIRIG